MKTKWEARYHLYPQHPPGEINLEKLLNRPSIALSPEFLPSHVQGQRVLLTGAAGSIGSELAFQLARLQPEALYLLDQSESGLYALDLSLKAFKQNIAPFHLIVANVCDPIRMDGIFASIKPNMVFHAAAYKHVPLMEGHPYEAIHTNVLGTKIIADLSIKYGIKDFLFISTDKAVSPANIMGATKKLAEQYLQTLQAMHADKTRFIITRFGNVLGSSGSVLPLFLKQIKEGGPVTITHPDMLRYFMTISEACQLVLESSAMAVGGQIYIFDMGAAVRIVALARQLIEQAGLREGRDIDIHFTGLRPGEKLWEEILNPYETALPSSHPKIMIVHRQGTSFQDADIPIETMLRLAAQGQTQAVIELLAQYVQGYQLSLQSHAPAGDVD